MTQTTTPSGHPLIFSAERFEDLFEEHLPWKSVADQPFTPVPIHNPGAEGMTIGSYCMLPDGEALHVKPKPELVKVIEANTIGINYDKLYFKIIHHDDGRSLVVCSYNQIIGSRWLARIDSTTVPEVRDSDA